MVWQTFRKCYCLSGRLIPIMEWYGTFGASAEQARNAAYDAEQTCIGRIAFAKVSLSVGVNNTSGYFSTLLKVPSLPMWIFSTKWMCLMPATPPDGCQPASYFWYPDYRQFCFLRPFLRYFHTKNPVSWLTLSSQRAPTADNYQR